MDGLFWTSRRHWWVRVNNIVIEFHLSETSGLSGKRTRIARLVDRDANDCAIPPPLHESNREWSVCTEYHLWCMYTYNSQGKIIKAWTSIKFKYNIPLTRQPSYFMHTQAWKYEIYLYICISFLDAVPQSQCNLNLLTQPNKKTKIMTNVKNYIFRLNCLNAWQSRKRTLL